MEGSLTTEVRLGTLEVIVKDHHGRLDAIEELAKDARTDARIAHEDAHTLLNSFGAFTDITQKAFGGMHMLVSRIEHNSRTQPYVDMVKVVLMGIVVLLLFLDWMHK